MENDSPGKRWNITRLENGGNNCLRKWLPHKIMEWKMTAMVKRQKITGIENDRNASLENNLSGKW